MISQLLMNIVALKIENTLNSKIMTNNLIHNSFLVTNFHRNKKSDNKELVPSA